MPSFRDELPPMVRLAGPIVLAELGWMFMAIVDTMMVGRLPYSADAIGAVSLGSVLFYTVGIFGTGMMLGLDTLVAQSFGAGRIDDCHHSLINGVYLSLVAGPVLVGIVWMLGEAMRHFGMQPEILSLALPYLHALSWSMFPLLLYFVFRRYLQGMNLVKPVMFALISANIVNLCGNWIFIYGHFGFRAMGPVGSGWATCFSRVYMAAVLLAYIIYYDHRHKTGLRAMEAYPDFARVRRLVSLGIPAAAQLTVEVGVFAVATSLIARLGAIPLASHQIALNAASFTYMVPLGIGSAAAVRVGQALGRKDPEGARRAGSTAVALGAGFMGCMAIVFWVVPRPIVRIFTPDVSVIQAAVKLLFVAAFFQLFDGIQAVTTGALRGTGDTRTPLVCHLLAYWVIGLPLGYYLCFDRGWGAVGLWTGLSAGLILIGIALLFFWQRTVGRFSSALR
ncbi:MAG: MATE family efflux transporter [Candidatus Acidiferrales bacterium]